MNLTIFINSHCRNNSDHKKDITSGNSINRMKIRTVFFILPLLLSFFPVSKISAQVLCQGAFCSQIPLSQQQYALFVYSFGENYLDEVMKDMAKAGALAGASSFPIGTINLDKKFSVGASGMMAVTKPRLVGDLYVPGVGAMNYLPSAGIAFAPRFYAGFNLGRLIGQKRKEVNVGIKNTAEYIKKKKNNEEIEEIEKPGRLSPLRFDIYLSGLTYTASYSRKYNYKPFRPELHMQDRGKFKTETAGIQVRYHLLDSFKVLGPLFSFRGLSLGIGLFKSSMLLQYFMGGEAGDLEMGLHNGDSLLIDGVNIAYYDSNITSVPAELNTGIRLLSVLNLSIGAGASFQKGSSQVRFLKLGNAYLQSDINQALTSLALNPAGGFNVQSGLMAMYMTGDAKIPSAIAYFKTGVELNLFALKLSLDTYYAHNQTLGWNVGARLEF